MNRSSATKAAPLYRVVLFVLLLAVPVTVLAVSALNGFALDEVVIDVVGLAAYGVVAGIVIFRRNGHLVGWLLLGLGATLVSVSRLPGFPGVSASIVNWERLWVGRFSSHSLRC